MAHFIPIGLCSGPMSPSSNLTCLLSGLPALLLSAHFAWALAEPDLPWNRDLAASAGTLVLCEFFLVHATGMSAFIRGRFGHRVLVGIGLAVFYALFLAGFAIQTGATWSLVAVAALIAGRFATALLERPVRAADVLLPGLVNAGAFVLLLAVTNARLLPFGCLYFAVQALIAFAPLLGRPRVPEPGFTPLGAGGIRLRYTDEGLEIASGPTPRDALPLALFGAAPLAMGLAALFHGRHGVAILFGIVVSIAGGGLLLGAVHVATRSLRVIARQGELSWIRSGINGREPSRPVPVDAVGRLHSTWTVAESDKITRFALRLGDARGRPQIDGFETREDAEALGKMIAGELRYGARARDAVAAETDVAALLHGGGAR